MISIGSGQLQNAESRCADLGASVPLPRNANENGEYDAAFSEFVGSYSYVALGVSDVATEGVWLDNDGNAVEFTNWRSGQPDNWGGNEDYAAMWTRDGSWWDESATYTAKIICEKLVD